MTPQQAGVLAASRHRADEDTVQVQDHVSSCGRNVAELSAAIGAMRTFDLSTLRRSELART